MRVAQIPANSGTAVGTRPANQVDTVHNAAVMAHRVATRTPAAEIAAALQQLLGRELTALISGIQSARTVGQWARGETDPHPANEERLRNAFRVVILLREGGETERTVRSWFTGMNPHLDDRAPAQVISEDPAAVLAAAKDFVLYL